MPQVSVRRVQSDPDGGYGTWTNRRAELSPKLRCSPVTSRTPSRRSSLSATAVSAQLRSRAMAAVSASSAMADQNVPRLENIQYQNQMTSAVPPQAPT